MTSRLGTRWLGLAAFAALLAAGTARADDDLRVVKPDPGRDVVKPMKPDWCAAYKGEDKSSCDAHCQERTLESFISNTGGDLGEDDLPRIAVIACDFPGNARVQQQVAYFRQSWINKTGLSERADRAALRLYAGYSAAGALDAAAKAECGRLSNAGQQGSEQRHRSDLIAAALCNGDPLSRAWSFTPKFGDLLALERPGATPAMIASAYYVFHSFRELDPSSDSFGYTRPLAEKAYPIAGVVLAQMDPKRLETEITSLGLTGILANRARVLFGGARTIAQAWGTYIRAESAKVDPKLGKAIDDAAAGYARWNKDYQDHKPDFDLAFAVEDRVMTSADVDLLLAPHHIDCEPLRAALVRHVTDRKPKTKDDVTTALTDVAGYPMFARLVLCDAAEGRWADAAAERKILQLGRFRSGGYTAAVWGVLDGGNQVPDGLSLEDDVARETDRILEEHVQRVSTLNEAFTGTGGISEEDAKREGEIIAQGRIAKVAKIDGGIRLTFKKVSWIEPTYECTQTNRIINFESDGTPIYFSDCKITGTHTETFQPDPRVFTDRSAAGVKVGQDIKIVTSELAVKDQSPDRPTSFVLEVDRPARGKKPATPVRYFGIDLK